MNIKVLISGCEKCKHTYTLLKNAADKMANHEVTVTAVDDILEILKYDIISPPAVIVNEKVVHKGHIENEEKAEELLRQLLQK